MGEKRENRMDKPNVVTRVRRTMSGATCVSPPIILDHFPTMDAEDCRVAIEQAYAMLAANAPWAND